MEPKREIPARSVLDEIAVKSGVAVVVVDRSGIEVSASNDNSICAALNPDGELVGDCAAHCGRALSLAAANSGVVNYTCHAGLACKAAALYYDERPVAVIAGRTFLSSENYKAATARAMDGDWANIADRLFDNILLSGSPTVLDEAIASIIKRSVEIEPPIIVSVPEEKKTEKPLEISAEPSADRVPRETADIIAQMAQRLNSQRFDEPVYPDAQHKAEPATDASAWRSFLASLLSKDYISARNAMIEFLTAQYQLHSIVWLERRGDRLESTAVSAALVGRSVKLGIGANDPVLKDAAEGDMPVELGKRSDAENRDSQKMLLFAMPVGNEVPAALVVLDRIADAGIRRQIARFCAAVAHQLEILRLRGEVDKREQLAEATRKVTEGLRHIDSADFWTHLTRVSAELLQAERASLITRDDNDEELEIRASIGILNDLSKVKDAGDRVARIVFEKGKPVVVTDVSTTGLPPAEPERNYRSSSFISAPLSVGGKQIAVINFTDKAGGTPFDRRDLEMLRAISPQLASAIDRTRLKEKAGEFEQLSVTDTLTGLLNRRYLEQRLAEEVKRSNRHGYPMSFVMLDVDHFKSFNDNFGHLAGDEALKLVAKIVRDTLRGADVAARFGGEEFAILLPQTTDEEAATIAERVRHNIESAEFPHRKVTVSMGIASCSAELCSTMNLIAAADKALYKAKDRGRNQVCVFERLKEMPHAY